MGKNEGVIMYSVNLDEVHLLLKYTDVFPGKVMNLEEEIQKLNMHKAISIICELIRIRNSKLDPIRIFGYEIEIPFESSLKVNMCGIKAESPKEMFSNPLLKKNTHIISAQMLLLLLKKVIQKGKNETLTDNKYEVSYDDYKNIIKLQLLVAEEIERKHEKNEFDANHFLYSTYHLNYQRNLANEVLRMYYMMEKLCKDKSKFDDIEGEYRNYYDDFANKYGFTPTEYSSCLFWEVREYYSNINGLTYNSTWKSVDEIYGKTNKKELIKQVICELARPTKDYVAWAEKTEAQEWDFSKFFEFPFITDQNGKYISISDITLRNAFFEKLFWLIRECYSKEDDRAMSFFGRLFERYIQDISKEAANDIYQYIDEFEYKKGHKSSDAYIQRGNSLLVIEAKGFSVLLNCMTKNEQVEKNNNKLFINPIIQADSCLKDIIDNKLSFSEIEEAYVISVTMDNINAIPEFYNNIYSEIEKKKKCEKIKYFFNFNIEEYEMLMYLMENNEDIFALLKEYFNSKDLKPFSNYLHDKFSDIDMTMFMKQIYQEVSDTMKEIIFEN